MEARGAKYGGGFLAFTTDLVPGPSATGEVDQDHEQPAHPLRVLMTAALPAGFAALSSEGLTAPLHGEGLKLALHVTASAVARCRCRL